MHFSEKGETCQQQQNKLDGSKNLLPDRVDSGLLKIYLRNKLKQYSTFKDNFRIFTQNIFLYRMIVSDQMYW